MPQQSQQRKVRPPRAVKPIGRTRKVTVTIPAETLEAALERVEEGKASSLSAYVSKALADRVAADGQEDSFLAFLDRLDEELGPPSAEDYEWARRFARGE